jgi:hypothetical protein
MLHNLPQESTYLVSKFSVINLFFIIATPALARKSFEKNDQIQQIARTAMMSVDALTAN